MKDFKVIIARMPAESTARLVDYFDTAEQALDMINNCLNNPLGADYKCKDVTLLSLHNGLYACLYERRISGVLMNCYMPVEYYQ